MNEDFLGKCIAAMCLAFTLVVVGGLALALAEHGRESKFIDVCVDGNKQHPQAFSLCYLELIKAKQMNAVTQFPVQQVQPAEAPPSTEKK